MRKYLGPIIGLGAIALIALWAMNFYNGSVGLNEDVSKQWSNVENAYQLRADKTKNLVEMDAMQGATPDPSARLDFAMQWTCQEGS